MYATWPMVFGALVAGGLAGAMIPERPASSPSAVTEWAHGKSAASQKANGKPAEQTASKPAETTAKTSAADGKPRAVAETSVTPAPKTSETKGVQAVPVNAAAQPDPAPRASCETEKWPYRSSTCLDRTASVLPAQTVVKTKRVDPAISMKSTNPDEGKKQIAEDKKPAEDKKRAEEKKQVAEEKKQVAEEKPAPKPDTEKKTASIEPQDDEAEQNDRRAERARAETDDREIRSEPARRSTQRRVTRRAPDRDDEYTGRVYYRDQYGRLYLAPELRHQLPPPPRYWR
jgi:hypothetical protein